MKTKKILVDCHVFDETFQGTTSYLKGLYSELIQDKSKTYYLVANHPDKLEKIFDKHQNVFYLKYKFKNKFLRLLFDIPFLIRKHKIDFAHFQYIVSPIKMCKYIVTVHDVLFLDFPKYFPKSYKVKNGFLFKWSAKKSDIVLTVSEYSKQRIQKHFGISNIFVTHNAIDPLFLEEYNKREVQAYIKHTFGIENFFLFVSRFEPRKNHLTLLKVFVENKYYSDRMLVFIGNKAIDCEELDKYYQELPKEIKEKIKFLEKIKFTDLVAFTKAADLSVYPSIAEGFGIPPLESLAAETPVICSNSTAMSDFKFIKPFLFNPLDKNELNQKIIQALNHTDWKANKQKMLEKYSWEKSANEFLKAIERV